MVKSERIFKEGKANGYAYYVKKAVICWRPFGGMTKKCSIPPDNPQPLTLAQRGNWVDGESLAEMLKKKG